MIKFVLIELDGGTFTARLRFCRMVFAFSSSTPTNRMNKLVGTCDSNIRKSVCAMETLNAVKIDAAQILLVFRYSHRCIH